MALENMPMIKPDTGGAAAPYKPRNKRPKKLTPMKPGGALNRRPKVLSGAGLKESMLQEAKSKLVPQGGARNFGTNQANLKMAANKDRMAAQYAARASRAK